MPFIVIRTRCNYITYLFKHTILIDNYSLFRQGKKNRQYQYWYYTYINIYLNRKLNICPLKPFIIFQNYLNLPNSNRRVGGKIMNFFFKFDIKVEELNYILDILPTSYIPIGLKIYFYRSFDPIHRGIIVTFLGFIILLASNSVSYISWPRRHSIG